MIHKNKQRDDLTALIQVHTPTDYQKEAEELIKGANEEGLSPITLNRLLLLGQEGSNRKTYDVRNLAALSFAGIDYDLQGTSVTGQDTKVLVRLENYLGNSVTLGWQTAKKYLKADANSKLMDLAEIMASETRTEEDYSRAEGNTFRDYVKNYEDVKKDPNKIKNIQSTIEKRQVQALLGLDEAVREASNELYKGLGDFVQSKEFYTEQAEHIFSLIAPRGGLIKRLQAYEGLSIPDQKKLILVHKHKKTLSPEVYAEYIHDLSIIDRLVTPLHAEGHLRKYLQDLNVLASEGRIGGRPANVVKALGLLQTEKIACTAAEILPFTTLYKVPEERITRGEKAINKNKEYAEDYASGKEMLKNIFIGEDNSWKGSDTKSIPLTISNSLEGIVKKRADPILKEVQRRMRDEYASKGNEEIVLASNSFLENEAQTENIVLLARRKRAKELGRENIVMDAQHTNEYFSDKYGITLTNVLGRIEKVEAESKYYDRRISRELFAYMGENEEIQKPGKEVRDLNIAKNNGFYHEATIQSLEEKKYMGKNILEAIIELEEWTEEDTQNNNLTKKLITHPAILETSGLAQQVSKEQTYISPEKRKELAMNKSIAEKLGDAEEWKEYANAITRYKILNEERRGKRSHKVLAKNSKTSNDVTARVMDYSGENYLVTENFGRGNISYINPEKKR